MLKFGRRAALVAADSLSWVAERVEKSTFGRTDHNLTTLYRFSTDGARK